MITSIFSQEQASVHVDGNDCRLLCNSRVIPTNVLLQGVIPKLLEGKMCVSV